VIAHHIQLLWFVSNGLLPSEEQRVETSQLAQRVSAGVSGGEDQSAVGATQSAENVSGIVFNAGLFQHGDEFFFKRHFTMMSLLILNVPHDRCDIRLAHPEPAVPLLPGEPADFAAHPRR